MAEFYVLPLYADEVAAGTPREMRDAEIEGPAVIHRAWCPHPSQTDYVRVHATGTSMEPTIPAGSIVTIDRSQTDPSRLTGRVVALGLADGGVTLKRLTRTARGGFLGVPDNPSEEHRAIHLEEGDRIVGLVRTVHARLA
jgi:phage repressor protein C with HTH and peptisase S24 domain